MATDHAGRRRRRQTIELTGTEAWYLLAAGLVYISWATALLAGNIIGEFLWLWACLMPFALIWISIDPLIEARRAAKRERRLDTYVRSAVAANRSPFEIFVHAYVDDREYGRPNVSRRQHYLNIIEATHGYTAIIDELRSDRDHTLARVVGTPAVYEATRDYFNALLCALGAEESSLQRDVVDFVRSDARREVLHGA